MKLKSPFFLAAGIILVVALFLRFYQLGQVPVSLYWDETAILLDAKTIATNGMDMHRNGWLRTMFPSYGDYKLPVYIWMAALSVKVFGATEFALRLPSALAGLGTVLLAGLLGYELSKSVWNTSTKSMPQVTGLLTAAMMAITPWSIMFSRTGFEGHLGQFWAAFSIYLAIKAVKHKWLLLPSVLLGGLATYTYFSVRFVWPVVFTFFWLLSNRDSFFQLLKPRLWIKKNVLVLVLLGMSLVGYMALLQPMFNSPLYEASNQFRLSTTSVLNSHDYAVESNILREQAGNSVIDRVIFHRHWLMIRELLKNYSDNLNPSFLFITGDPNLRHGTSKHGVLLLPMLPLLLLGIYLLAKKNWLLLAGLAGWWILALLPASIPETTPHALRSLNALMPVVLLVGFGASQLASWVIFNAKNRKNFSKIVTLGIVGSLVSMLVLATISFSFHYFAIYPHDSAYDWQDGYRQLVTTVLERKDGVRTVWIDPAEDRFYLWLLAYGPYTAEQIQAIPTVGYKVQAVDTIVFKGFEWDRLASLDHQAMVVGQPHDIEEKVSRSGVTPAEVIKVFGADRKTERYRVVIFKPNL